MAEARALFSDVCFLIMPCDDIAEDEEQLLGETLRANGAQSMQEWLHEDGRIVDISRVTHIISTHVDFPEWQEVIEHGISVVKPAWVADSVAKGRLAMTRQYNPDPTQFFNEVILTCGTLPESDEDAIIAGVLALGGQYSSALTKIVTHIVSTDMENEKCLIAQEKSLKVKIVLPHWFDDCLRLGKKIDERPYLLPEPEICNPDIRDAVKLDTVQAVQGASDARPHYSQMKSPVSPQVSPSKSRKNINAFRGKQLFLCSDLALSDHLDETLIRMIGAAGGAITKQLDEAEIYVGQYRETAEFVDAFVAGKIIGNLSWLFHVLNQNCWSNPQSKLLHYPVPKNGMPDFKKLRISVSNYSGDARNYVQNLIKESGAEFTKTMKQDNTHLITAHKTSEKCDAAQEWNIHITNSLWLEESYAKCSIQTLTNSRYTHFPSRTNLGEICGRVAIDPEAIEQYYIRPVMAVREKEEQRRYGKKNGVVPHPSTPSTVKGSLGPAHPAHLDIGKENETPLLSGRASKLKAIGTLHAQADDMLQFQKELKRKGGVLHGNPRSSAISDDSALMPHRAKKRSSAEISFQDDTEAHPLSDGESQARGHKRNKISREELSSVLPQPTSKLPAIKHRLMLSGDDRWAKSANQAGQDKDKLRQLGIRVTEDPKQVTILAAPKILRTKKFVAAIANAPIVVDSKRLDDIIEGKLECDNLPPLDDKTTEKAWNVHLAQALTRAKVNKHKLFRGWNIHVSDHLPAGFETYKEIISVNGGNALAFRGTRKGTKLSSRSAADDEAGEESQNQGGEEELDFVYLVSNNTPADKKLWKQFRDSAREQGLRARIVKSDWLLLSALSQQIRWNADWEWAD